MLRIPKTALLNMKESMKRRSVLAESILFLFFFHIVNTPYVKRIAIRICTIVLPKIALSKRLEPFDISASKNNTKNSSVSIVFISWTDL